MAHIAKIAKSGKLVKIPISILKTSNLNLKEKGLYIHVCSFANDWNYSQMGTSKICADGITSIKHAMSTLINTGYVEVKESPREKGKFAHRRASILFRDDIDFSKFVMIPFALCKGCPARDSSKEKKDKESLTLAELALWTILYSLPPNWDYSDRNLALEYGGKNENMIRNARYGLMRKKYLIVNKSPRRPNGQYSDDEYLLTIPSVLNS